MIYPPPSPSHFIDGDTLHPASNIEKMTRGIPLTDDDRLPWLALIRSTGERVCREEWDMEHDPRYAAKHAGHGHAVQPIEEHPETRPEDRTKPLREQDKADHWREHWTGIKKEGEGGIGRPGVVIACSALRKWYRDILRGEVQAEPPAKDDLVRCVFYVVMPLTLCPCPPRISTTLEPSCSCSASHLIPLSTANAPSHTLYPHPRLPTNSRPHTQTPTQPA